MHHVQWRSKSFYGVVVFSNRGNWCKVGDFNMVRSVEERQGCRVVTVGIDEFNKVIDDSESVELPFKGKAFSWFGPETSRSWPGLIDFWCLRSGSCILLI